MNFRCSLLAAALVLSCSICRAQTYRGQIGAEVEIGEGNRSRAFTDLAKTWRPADGMKVDANGWPATDFEFLFFDLRPYAGWDSSIGIDDPEKFIPDWSGAYSLSFSGQANIQAAADPVTIADQSYDPTSNRTTATVQVPAGTAIFSLKFSNTRRTATSDTNTGITGMKLIRPGYPADGSVTYTDEFLNSLQPYRYMRFMGVLGTNGADPVYEKNKPLAENQKPWSARHLTSDATQQDFAGKVGIAWEYVIELGNATGKDIWINVPVSASDDYVRQLAKLMHSTLKPGIRIYIEHGNEVWNASFTTYAWNRAASDAEVAAGPTKLNQNPPPPSGGWPCCWDEVAQRRHARRLIEISRMFLDEYGDDSLETIIRPVYAGFVAAPSQYDRVLDWVSKNIGNPSKLIYALAQTHYFNDNAARRPDATVDTVLNAFRADSDGGIAATKLLHETAAKYGIRQVIYEGGPDIGRTGDPAVQWDTPSSKVPAVTASITACRDQRIKDIVLHDMRDNWFQLGGGEYTYFTASGGVSRWGCWGAVEDVVGPKASSPKLDAVLEMVGGTLRAPTVSSIVNAASFQAPIPAGGFATIFGSGFAGEAFDQWGGMVVSRTLPAVVGGVAVRVNGKDAVVSFAGPEQINFVVPPDAGGGQATVEVIAPGGRARASVEVSAYAPGYFANSLNGASQVAALFANTSVHVAPEGAWPGVESRPAKPGDILQVYATGLGPSAAPFGKVLTQAYEIDRSAITVTIDGVSAEVLWAGVTFAGVYQVNIAVPPIQRGGSLPVTLTVSGQSAPGGVLTFAVN